DDGFFSLATDIHANLSARGCVLAAVVEEVAEHLRQTDRVGMQMDRFGRQNHVDGMASGLSEWLRRQHGLTKHRREFNVTLAQLDAVVSDPAQIEEVVDQPDQLLELSLHRVQS